MPKKISKLSLFLNEKKQYSLLYENFYNLDNLKKIINSFDSYIDKENSITTKELMNKMLNDKYIKNIFNQLKDLNLYLVSIAPTMELHGDTTTCTIHEKIMENNSALIQLIGGLLSDTESHDYDCFIPRLKAQGEYLKLLELSKKNDIPLVVKYNSQTDYETHCNTNNDFFNDCYNNIYNATSCLYELMGLYEAHEQSFKNLTETFKQKIVAYIHNLIYFKIKNYIDSLLF